MHTETHFIEHTQNQETLPANLKKRREKARDDYCPLICSLLPGSLVHIIPRSPQFSEIFKKKKKLCFILLDKNFCNGQTCLLCPITSLLGVGVTSTSF